MRFVFVVLAGLAAFVAAPHAAGAADQKVVLTRLTDRLYVAEDYFYAKENSLVYVGASSVTVVGATWTPQTARLLAAEIAEITRKPIKAVIDTNYNLDRAGGNAYFKSIGARIVATRMTHDLLQKDGDEQIRLTQKAFPDYPNVPIVLPDEIFPGDFELQGGAVRGLYLGPSHMPDDIFVYFPKQKVLYGGCVLKEHLGNMAGANVTEYARTLRKLKALHLDIKTIVAGHWSPVHGPELIDQYLQMLARYRP